MQQFVLVHGCNLFTVTIQKTFTLGGTYSQIRVSGLTWTVYNTAHHRNPMRFVDILKNPLDFSCKRHNLNLTSAARRTHYQFRLIRLSHAERLKNPVCYFNLFDRISGNADPYSIANAFCQKGSQIKVKDVMYTPAEGEYVQEDATLDEAIHQLVIGRHQSLLVTRESRVVGVLRLSDVFGAICSAIRSSQG